MIRWISMVLCICLAASVELSAEEKAFSRADYLEELYFDQVSDEHVELARAAKFAISTDNTDLFASLLGAGLQINSPLDGNGREYRALHLAARNGSPKMVKFLLQHGADKELVSYYGNYAIECAIESNESRVCELLARDPAGDKQVDGVPVRLLEKIFGPNFVSEQYSFISLNGKDPSEAMLKELKRIFPNAQVYSQCEEVKRESEALYISLSSCYDEVNDLLIHRAYVSNSYGEIPESDIDIVSMLNSRLRANPHYEQGQRLYVDISESLKDLKLMQKIKKGCPRAKPMSAMKTRIDNDLYDYLHGASSYRDKTSGYEGQVIELKIMPDPDAAGQFMWSRREITAPSLSGWGCSGKAEMKYGYWLLKDKLSWDH
ncbi:ankyrin repeat domain-containing protein [Persicirhabdus sediminis]|uniref:Ankyrin repeat domain-containing protein n=1 Tax=Persicirhabdus sediminis TaxID=454144 RepID=A0A8J7SM71_9BACT|nr:ankyrin repeat domain-containing protein [Persicirhabdus sediminis]MBK1790908.1 ankyrin repeat domain-containing protein [Persicirhabdus sediminis]